MEVLGELEHRLPCDLYYHSLCHTMDVLHEVLLFACNAKLTQHEIRLLAIAAAYHDAGFIYERKNNEDIGARLARQAMREQGSFTPEEISTVETMIIDTRLISGPAGPKQFASTSLSRYLLDADLSNIGREDFFEKSEMFCREMRGRESDFFVNALKLLEAHDWHTEVAREFRQAQKEKNLALLRELIERDTEGE